MFEQLFKYRSALVRQNASALSIERRHYLEHLARQQISPSVLKIAAYYTVAIVERLHLADNSDKPVTAATIDRHAIRWARRDPARAWQGVGSSPRQRFRHYAKDWLRFMGRLEEPHRPAGPFDEQIAAFATYMADEQGLSPVTIRGRILVLHDLLARSRVDPRSLRSLTVTDLDRSMDRKLARHRYTRGTISSYGCVLRAFFRFAAIRGWCRKDLADSIHVPHIYRRESVPFGPIWTDVQRLLATAAGPQPVKVRNRAILLLLSVYGLRAGEVVRLRLDDFEWTTERLKIWRPKQRKAQEFPLIRSVGDAVLDYLRRARPISACREVFLTCRPPYRPLLAASLWPLVAQPLRALNVKLPHYGPHCLRHACATHLLDAGLPLKNIGDQLGHRHPDSTRIYTKVDLPHLREVGTVDLSGLL